MSAEPVLELEGRRIRLTNLDRVIWPDAGFTKGDLIAYYRSVGEALLPHLADRPVTLGRWPGGVHSLGFAQTECRGRPEWMGTRELRLRGGVTRRFCVIDDLPALIWIANLTSIELHVYPWTWDRVDEPTVAVLDLDPGPAAGRIAACRVALRLRELLADRDLVGCPKTSGGTGLHVYVPLEEPHPASEATKLARALAAEVAAEGVVPIAESARARTADSVLVDWRQSEPRRTTVAPYSLRATDLPLVSAPVRWEEIERAVERDDAGTLDFGPSDVIRRLESEGDLFAGVLPR